MPMFHPKGGDHSNMVKCPAKSPETCRLNKYGNAIHVEASSREEANEMVARSMGLSEVDSLGGVSAAASSVKEPTASSASIISSDNKEELLSTLESRLEVLRSSGDLHADIKVGDGSVLRALLLLPGFLGTTLSRAMTVRAFVCSGPVTTPLGPLTMTCKKAIRPTVSRRSARTTGMRLPGLLRRTG